MLKKLSLLILIILTMFLGACSNTKIIKESSTKNEVIRQVMSTPQKDVILLGTNYDYLFTGEEAKKLLTLIDFFRIEGLNENINYIKKSLTINENGIVKLHVDTEFEFQKKNENNINDKKFAQEQEEFIYNFKKKLDEKKIEYKIKENTETWKFSLPNTINIEGKVAKLENHNKILQENSSQLINLNIDLTEVHQKEVRRFSPVQIAVGTVGVILCPILLPIIFLYN
ncbi:hypothetical protein KSU03_03185 [Fusobacterium polymorphum]|uniref:hypothetical protein n=1 Tax=Fusobacterium nucleatum subsp. polymorphum TaxID=76857 RepID=UPI00164DC23E|nr:hypothetical protein [Fusobacterium polymorphum]